MKEIFMGNEIDTKYPKYILWQKYFNYNVEAFDCLFSSVS